MATMPKRTHPRKFTRVIQIRFTDEQYADLVEISEQHEIPMSAVVRNVVGVWLLHRIEHPHAELVRRVDELIELQDAGDAA
jgi:hypothetical protein